MDVTSSLVNSIVELKSSPNDRKLPSDFSQRLEASQRVEAAYEKLDQSFEIATPELRSWAMSGTHGISTPLQIIDYYDVDQLPDESRPWYEETRQAIYGLQEGMQRLHWVLCTLSPVSEDVRCPENPKIPSVLWSSLGTLLFRANPDGVEIMTPEQRGIFVRSEMMYIVLEIFKSMDFPPALHWMSSSDYFVSSYAAQALSGMYETLAGVLAKLVDFQVRALAMEEEGQLIQLGEEFSPSLEWAEEQITTLQQSGQALRDAVAEEQAWRDGILKCALVESETLAQEGSLDQACQLLHDAIGNLPKDSNATSPPLDGVDPRQLEYLLRTRLHELYQQSREIGKISSSALELHILTREILGHKSNHAADKSSAYAMSITAVEIPNPTARDILLSAAEGAEPQSELTGIIQFLLGRTLAALGDIDTGLIHLNLSLSIFEANLSEMNHYEFDAAAKLISRLLHTRGRTTEDYDLARRVSTTSAERLGATHPLTAKHLVDLGYSELGRGHPDEAEAPLLRAVEIFGGLGDGNLDEYEMQRALGNLMSVYNSQGRYEDTVRVGRRLVVARERVLGPTAWESLMSMAKLGEALCCLGNIAAEKEGREVLLEARRRITMLEEKEGQASCVEISDMISRSLFAFEGRKTKGKGKTRGEEEEGASSDDTELRHAEERVARLGLAQGALLYPSDTGAIAHLINMYLVNEMPDKAFNLVQQVNGTVGLVDGNQNFTWCFDGWLGAILQHMSTCTDEFVEACRKAVPKYDNDEPRSREFSDGVKQELVWGTALLRARREKEGAEVLWRCMDHSEKLEKDGSMYYRLALSRLFQHYTHEALMSEKDGDNGDDDGGLASKPPEFWDKLILLLKPKGSLS